MTFSRFRHRPWSKPMLEYVNSSTFYCTLIWNITTIFWWLFSFSIFPIAWILGSIMCKIVPYIQGVSVAASVYSLCAVSIDRYVKTLNFLNNEIANYLPMLLKRKSYVHTRDIYNLCTQAFVYRWYARLAPNVLAEGLCSQLCSRSVFYHRFTRRGHNNAIISTI